jgi:hypothetical protein
MLQDSSSAFAYDREETLVVGDPDDPTTGPTEVVVQLLVPKMNADDPETAFHRPFLRQSRTACDVAYHSEFVTPRPESYDQTVAPLCRRGCFTASELAHADAIRADEKRRTGEHAPLTRQESAAEIGARWLKSPPNGKRRK